MEHSIRPDASFCCDLNFQEEQRLLSCGTCPSAGIVFGRKMFHSYQSPLSLIIRFVLSSEKVHQSLNISLVIIIKYKYVYVPI